MKSHYLPASDQEKTKWLKNFSRKFPHYANLFGFTEEEIKSLCQDTSKYSKFVSELETNGVSTIRKPLNQKEAQEPTKPNTDRSSAISPPAFSWILKRVAHTVSRLKNHPNYTSRIGSDLGIEKS